LVCKTSKSTYARKTQNIGIVSKRFVYVLVSNNTVFVLYRLNQIYTDHDQPRVILYKCIGITSNIIFQTALPSIGNNSWYSSVRTLWTQQLPANNILLYLREMIKYHIVDTHLTRESDTYYNNIICIVIYTRCAHHNQISKLIILRKN